MRLIDLLNKREQGLVRLARTSGLSERETDALRVFLARCEEALHTLESRPRSRYSVPWTADTDTWNLLEDGESYTLSIGEDGTVVIDDDTDRSYPQQPVVFELADRVDPPAIARTLRDAQHPPDVKAPDNLGRPARALVDRLTSELHRLWKERRSVRRCQHRRCPVPGGRWFVIPRPKRWRPVAKRSRKNAHGQPSRKQSPRAVDCPYCRRSWSRRTRSRHRRAAIEPE